jgi:hypothetical protein
MEDCQAASVGDGGSPNYKPGDEGLPSGKQGH